MDEETRKLFQNLMDRLESQPGPSTSGSTQQGSVNQGPLNTLKQERPNIYNVSRSSALMPDPKFFRKLLGIDI